MKTVKAKTAAQVPFAEKAAALKAASRKVRNGVKARAHATRAPPDGIDLASIQDRLKHRCGLLDKRDVLALVGVTYPSLWAWMRAGTFPHGKIVGAKTMWPAADVADWLAGLPVRALKGDDKTTEAEVVA
jgi:predicted DNA-binding transcriptional regulator AlpA